jgi:hypothetical protein
MAGKKARTHSGAANDIPESERSVLNPNRRKGPKHAEYSAALKHVVATVKDSAKKNVANRAKMGRPVTFPYGDEIANEICERLCMGETLIDICDSSPDMPSRMVVYYWIETRPDFAALYARARTGFGEHAAHHVVSTAKTANEDNAQAVRILVDAFRWYAEKAAPRLYNSRIAESDAHRDATTINHVTNNVVISARDIAPEDRDRLRGMLLEARAISAKPVSDT